MSFLDDYCLCRGTSPDGCLCPRIGRPLRRCRSRLPSGRPIGRSASSPMRSRTRGSVESEAIAPAGRRVPFIRRLRSPGLRLGGDVLHLFAGARAELPPSPTVVGAIIERGRRSSRTPPRRVWTLAKDRSVYIGTLGQRAGLHIARIRQLGSALSVSSLEQGFDRVCNPGAETLGRDGRVRIWSGRAPREIGLRADAGADGLLDALAELLVDVLPVLERPRQDLVRDIVGQMSGDV